MNFCTSIFFCIIIFHFITELDVVSGIIGDSKPSNGDSDSSGVSINRPIDPFFSPFFNVFNFGHSGLFPGFGVPQSLPWWRG